MTLRTLLSAVALSSSLALAACGGDERSAAQPTAEQAVAEIGPVRSALDDAVAAVRRGDAKRADEILSAAYVDHFETVEGPLGEVDPELKESLEHTLSTTIRDTVKRGAPVRAVQALVDGAKADLDTAEAKLR
jgi:hypothetical protein